MAIDQKFPNGMKVVQVPLSWFRKVTAFLNNLCAGTGLKRSNPTAPSDVTPVEFSIDEEWLDEKVAKATEPLPDSDNVNNTQTGDGGVEGIASATDTTAYVDGDDVSDTAARITPLGAGEGSWTAGGAKGLKQYEVSRIAPFTYGSGSLPERYTKIFVRLVTRNHNGQVVSVGDEVDQGLVIQLH